MKLKNKVAIVTGAGSEMGRAIAEQFAREGAQVIVSDKLLNRAEAVRDAIIAGGGRAVSTVTDVTSEVQLEQLFEFAEKHFDKIDIIVNNAGIMDEMEPIGDVTNEKWNEIFAVNTTAVMVAMRLAANCFLKSGGGIIINNISVSGLHGSRAGATYTASKHAVVGLTKNTAYRYAKDNIRVNGIAPGIADSDELEAVVRANEQRGDYDVIETEAVPQMGEPEDVARLAVYLASEEANHINGQILTVERA